MEDRLAAGNLLALAAADFSFLGGAGSTLWTENPPALVQTQQPDTGQNATPDLLSILSTAAPSVVTASPATPLAAPPTDSPTVSPADQPFVGLTRSVLDGNALDTNALVNVLDTATQAPPPPSADAGPLGPPPGAGGGGGDSGGGGGGSSAGGGAQGGTGAALASNPSQANQVSLQTAAAMLAAAPTATPAPAAGLTLVAGAAPGSPATAAAPASLPGLPTQDLAAAYGNLPLAFEANVGQDPSGATFVSSGAGYHVGLDSTGASISLAAADGTSTALRLQLLGSDPQAQGVGQQELPGKSNYFLGSDPTLWYTDLSTFRQVVFSSVYSGIDAVYSGSTQQQLEYTFAVHPGASLDAIHLAVQGAQGLSLDASGDLVMQTAQGDLVQQAPILFQGDGAARQAVAGQFVLNADGTVGFAAGAYDPTQTLYVDPVLGYSTTFGGTSPQSGNAIAVDAQGEAFITGQTPGQAAGSTETLVMKLNAAGNAALYTTVLGGTVPHTSSAGNGIAIDAQGDAVVAGFSSAPNYPVVAAYQPALRGSQNAVISKLTPQGNGIVFSTFFGGTASEAALGVALDPNSNVAITGWTTSANGTFPLYHPLQSTFGGGSEDAFVAELPPQGTGTPGTGLVFSTLVGGTGTDEGHAIAAGPAGIFVTGSTTSATLAGQTPTRFGPGGGQDAFVVRLAPLGASLGYVTVVGGSGADVGNGIAVDSSGDAFFTGSTASGDFRTTPGAYQTTLAGGTDAFVVELNPGGTGEVFSTLLGGTANDTGNALALTPLGYVAVVGSTMSTNFPTQFPLQSANGSGGDAFVSLVRPDGTALPFSTYHGGSSSYRGNGIASDAAGSLYLTGANAAQSTAFVSKITFPPPVWGSGPTFTWTPAGSSPPVVTNPGSQTSAEGAVVSLQVGATDPNGYLLTYTAVDLPLGLSINASNGLISGTVDYQAAEDFSGSYSSSVIVSDGHGGSTTQNFAWTVTDTVRAPALTNPGAQTNAQGDSVALALNATQPDGDALDFSATGLPSGLRLDDLSGMISGTVDTTAAAGSPYTVTVTADDQGVTASQTFTWAITTANHPPVLTSPGNQSNAAGDAVFLPLTATDADGNPVTWTASNLPAGLSIDTASGTISGTLANSAASGTPYVVTVTASDGMASSSQTFNWTVNYVGVTNPGDQSNTAGDAVSLPITATSAGGTLGYSAQGLPSGLTINTSTGSISGTLPASAAAGSPYVVTVSASDGTHSASQTSNWTVAALALTSPGDQTGREGTAVSLQLHATDVGGTPTFSASGLPAGVSINTGTGLLSGTLGVAAHTSSPYQVTVTAADGANSVSQSFVWTVTPRVALVNPAPQGNAAGDSVSLPITASTVGGTLSYGASGLPAGLSVNTTTGLISGTIGSGAASGTPYSVTVTANDGTSSSSQTFPWTVSTLYLAPPANQSNLDGDTVSLALSANYHGSGSVSYAAANLPPGLSINAATGLISGTVSGTADAGGPYSVTVTATAGTNTSSQNFTWNIYPLVTVAAVSDQTNAVGDAVSLAVVGTNALNDPLSYSATGLPAGVSINTTTGLISGAVAAGADTSSPYAVVVTVSAGTISTTASFNWTVTHLAFANPGPQSSADGTSVNLVLSGHDADSDSVTYAAAGLPPGLSLNTTTGLISGTLSATADVGSPYNVTVTATDGAHPLTQSFLWTVTGVGVVNPGNLTSTEGGSVSLQVQATTPSGSLTYAASGLPSGLTENPATGLISGTVAAGAAAGGPYTVTVTASNGTTSFGQTFTWTVNPRISVTAPANQSNLEGDLVSLQIIASGSTGLSYSAANLPAGLSMASSTGLIGGTISAGAAAAGPYLVTVTVTDGTYSTDQTFGWSVAVASNASTTLGNPGAQANVAGDGVALALGASDPDNDPLTFDATGLPKGLSVDPFSGLIGGVLSSDAVSTTPYTVTVTADDGHGGTASQTFTWVVSDTKVLVQGASVSATEGTAVYGVTVGSFTDSDPYRQASDYTATIDWGDGTDPSTGVVTGSSGAFSVAGDHFYGHLGTYSVTLTVTDPSGNSFTGSGTATVASAPLAITGGMTDDGLAGASSTQTLATFTDPNTGDSASSYTATLNWGDGTGNQAGTVTGNNGTFTVSGGHSYAGHGSYSVSVTVADADGTTVSTTNTVVAADAYAGSSVSLSVANFTGDPALSAGNYLATINWGDGNSTPGTVSGSGGVYSVSGSHSYTQAGTFTAQVSVLNPFGETATASSSVIVAQAPVTLLGANVDSGTSLTVSNAVVGVLLDPNAADTAGSFTAAVDWGDGTALDTGAVVSGGNGRFVITGSHVYQQAQLAAARVLAYWRQGAQLIAQALETYIAAPAVANISGPTVVPGQSAYTYSVTFNGSVLKAAKGAPSPWAVKYITNPAKGVTLKPAVPVYNEGTNQTTFSVTATFANQPGRVQIQFNLKGYKRKPLPVTVVEIKTTFPAAYPSLDLDVKETRVAKALYQTQPTADTNWITTSTPGSDIAKFTFTGKTAKAFERGVFIRSTPGDTETYAIKTNAKVQLVLPAGANANVVQQLVLGYIQDAQEKGSGLYAGGKKRQQYIGKSLATVGQPTSLWTPDWSNFNQKAEIQDNDLWFAHLHRGYWKSAHDLFVQVRW
jgi:hypothetical protein